MHARLFCDDTNRYQKTSLHQTEIAHLSVNIVNHFNRASNLTTASILASVSRAMVDSLIQYLFLPISVLTAIITAILAWRRTSLDGYQPHGVAKAVLETLVACALAAALVGVLAFTALFSLAAPAISAATLCAKALFSIGSAIYFGIKASTATTETEKNEYASRAKSAAIDGTVGMIVTAALVTLLVFAAPVVKLIALIVGITSSVAACFLALARIKVQHAKASSDNENIYQRSSHAEISNIVGRNYHQPEKNEECGVSGNITHDGKNITESVQEVDELRSTQERLGPKFYCKH